MDQKTRDFLLGDAPKINSLSVDGASKDFVRKQESYIHHTMSDIFSREKRDELHGFYYVSMRRLDPMETHLMDVPVVQTKCATNEKFFKARPGLKGKTSEYPFEVSETDSYYIAFTFRGGPDNKPFNYVLKKRFTFLRQGNITLDRGTMNVVSHVLNNRAFSEDKLSIFFKPHNKIVKFAGVPSMVIVNGEVKITSCVSAYLYNYSPQTRPTIAPLIVHHVLAEWGFTKTLAYLGYNDTIINTTGEDIAGYTKYQYCGHEYTRVEKPISKSKAPRPKKKLTDKARAEEHRKQIQRRKRERISALKAKHTKGPKVLCGGEFFLYVKNGDVRHVTVDTIGGILHCIHRFNEHPKRSPHEYRITHEESKTRGVLLNGKRLIARRATEEEMLEVRRTPVQRFTLDNLDDLNIWSSSLIFVVYKSNVSISQAKDRITNHMQSVRNMVDRDMMNRLRGLPVIDGTERWSCRDSIEFFSQMVERHRDMISVYDKERIYGQSLEMVTNMMRAFITFMNNAKFKLVGHNAREKIKQFKTSESHFQSQCRAAFTKYGTGGKPAKTGQTKVATVTNNQMTISSTGSMVDYITASSSSRPANNKASGGGLKQIYAPDLNSTMPFAATIQFPSAPDPSGMRVINGFSNIDKHGVLQEHEGLLGESARQFDKLLRINMGEI